MGRGWNTKTYASGSFSAAGTRGIQPQLVRPMPVPASVQPATVPVGVVTAWSTGTGTAGGTARALGTAARALAPPPAPTSCMVNGKPIDMNANSFDLVSDEEGG